jgi:hypothetical protein
MSLREDIFIVRVRLGRKIANSLFFAKGLLAPDNGCEVARLSFGTSTGKR